MLLISLIFLMKPVEKELKNRWNLELFRLVILKNVQERMY